MSVQARVPIDAASIQVPRGQVYTIPNRCKGCNFCIQFCPKEVLEFSEAINNKGYHFPVVRKGMEEQCIHCRFCDLICPELAIFTREVEPATAVGASA
ncbi:MAG: 4Fe-4S dicluster domain-containing protein [Candidatus Hydrogenedentes bacterium]|nr:4Fe-4S dicluster domain-containing protein [Candidatus Hydrogenedentota bacterium]